METLSCDDIHLDVQFLLKFTLKSAEVKKARTRPNVNEKIQIAVTLSVLPCSRSEYRDLLDSVTRCNSPDMVYYSSVQGQRGRPPLTSSYHGHASSVSCFERFPEYRYRRIWALLRIGAESYSSSVWVAPSGAQRSADTSRQRVPIRCSSILERY